MRLKIFGNKNDSTTFAHTHHRPKTHSLLRQTTQNIALAQLRYGQKMINIRRILLSCGQIVESYLA